MVPGTCVAQGLGSPPRGPDQTDQPKSAMTRVVAEGQLWWPDLDPERTNRVWRPCGPGPFLALEGECPSWAPGQLPPRAETPMCQVSCPGGRSSLRAAAATSQQAFTPPPGSPHPGLWPGPQLHQRWEELGRWGDGGIPAKALTALKGAGQRGQRSPWCMARRRADLPSDLGPTAPPLALSLLLGRIVPGVPGRWPCPFTAAFRSQQPQEVMSA